MDATGQTIEASEAWNLTGLLEYGRGAYDAAREAFDRALQRSTASDRPAQQAEQLGNLGSVYFSLGRYDDAAAAFGRARALANAHTAEPWATGRLAVLDANDAALMQRLGRYDAALDRYRHDGHRNRSRASNPPAKGRPIIGVPADPVVHVNGVKR